MKKVVLKNFTGKHLYWNLLLIKLQAFLYPLKTGIESSPTLIKREFNTGVFNGYRKVCNFHIMPPGGCLCLSL